MREDVVPAGDRASVVPAPGPEPPLQGHLVARDLPGAVLEIRQGGDTARDRPPVAVQRDIKGARRRQDRSNGEDDGSFRKKQVERVGLEEGADDQRGHCADLEVRGEVVPRAEEQPDRQDGGDEAVEDWRVELGQARDQHERDGDRQRQQK